jgi:alpha-1,3-mannosyl-glycoprotein beta-1,2-N-acetylglucosaminyltransferase
MRNHVFVVLACICSFLWLTIIFILSKDKVPQDDSPDPNSLEFRLKDVEAKLSRQIEDNKRLLENITHVRHNLEKEKLANDREALIANRTANDKPVVQESAEKGDDVIPVLLFACNRISVSKALDELISYRPDKKKYPIIVSQDCGHKETAKVIAGYGDQIISIIQPDLSEPVVPLKEKKFRGYFKIARHYGWALNETFNTMGYKQVIIVEDDLEISPDFYQYFSATLPILQEDKSLWCVSAWNDNGKAGLIDDKSADLLYRTDFFPGLGWMITKDLWAELSIKWARSYWDDWMREPVQRKNRACIRPEISRTKTFGKLGVSNGLFFEKHLKFIVLNSQNVQFMDMDLSYLLKDNYDKRFIEDVYKIETLSIQEIRQGFRPEVKQVRLTYRTREDFRRYSKQLGIMDDFKSGVPRMAYRGIVSFMYKGRRVYLAPSANWKGYDPKW